MVTNMSEWELCLVQMQTTLCDTNDIVPNYPTNPSIRIALDRNKYFIQVLSEAKVPVLLSTLPELSGMSRAAVRRSIKALVEQEKIKLAECRGPHGRTAITVALT